METYTLMIIPPLCLAITAVLLKSAVKNGRPAPSFAAVRPMNHRGARR